jgi:hypothetical protein
MANGDDLILSRFTVSGPLVTGGHPLQVPDLFIEPGSADFYRGYFGMTSITGLQQGTLNVGMNLTSPFALYGAPGSNHLLNACILNVVGDSTFTGNARVIGGEFRSTTASTNINSASINIVGAKTNITGITNNISGATINITGPNLTINGLSWFGYVVPKLAVAGKGFDIPHPTKPDTHRLRYICLEGPEVGTYLRGKLKDNNYIELPEYWTDKFIDPESITVSLTPVGTYQELFVEKIEWGRRIKIKNNSGSSINCHYTVFAERVMNDKLQVEYEGQSPADYPGDNSQYSLAGWNYDRR